MIRFTQLGLNVTSSSILNLKPRLDAVSSDQANTAPWAPILSSTSAVGIIGRLSLSEKESNSSVFKQRIRCRPLEIHLAHIKQEIIDTIERHFSSYGLGSSKEEEMKLVTEHVKNGHRTKDCRSTQLLLHDDGLVVQRISSAHNLRTSY